MQLEHNSLDLKTEFGSNKLPETTLPGKWSHLFIDRQLNTTWQSNTSFLTESVIGLIIHTSSSGSWPSKLFTRCKLFLSLKYVSRHTITYQRKLELSASSNVRVPNRWMKNSSSCSFQASRYPVLIWDLTAQPLTLRNPFQNVPERPPVSLWFVRISHRF